ncbi:DNA mismatch repair endonuclease MutL [Vibrio porteresiae]|uniref:DNA mismatch repair protein MutL n=1 Tax=Vibrio porteresiae DSM 19223 TaxID=1123496 RepID=A0ABZ0QFW7_9VIBR|nr:DNA mismatch repair endonuclease MutL [Vibrio porteresiae]WPC74386.1 DNA mismatch repair endonuclease MutL [Vibrio porteresiae DSM 19223]
MAIQILPARLANQIAAGEVVERPASVVKELVENSLDSGATRIDIDIEKGGAKLIRIRDNGSGIPKDELSLALSRHATSKIHNLDDLEAIMSLGFRGEALASISSVSRLTLTSRTPAQEEAWSAYSEGRDMAVQLQPAAHPVGTSVEVLDLFFNTPARRKFLRTEKTEFAHIDELVKRIALSRFDVTFSLRHNGAVVRQYRAAQTRAQEEKRVGAVCGSAFAREMLRVDLEHQGLKLSGWITTPEGARQQSDLQFCYVNGRMMKDKLINHAIRQSYETSLRADQYATYVLFIEIDPHQVDVNVHPAKHEVRFHQARLVHDFIYQAVSSALSQACHIDTPALNDAAFHITNDEEQDESAEASTSSVPERIWQAIEQTPAYPGRTGYEKPDSDSRSSQKDHQVKEATPSLREWQPSSRQAERKRTNDKGDNAPTAAQVRVYQQLMQTPPMHDQPHLSVHPEKNESVDFAEPIEKLGKAVAVIQGQYLVMGSAQGCVLVSLKQAEHLKLLGQLDASHQALKSQPLLVPLSVKVSPSEQVAVERYHDLFLQFGLDLQPRTKQMVMVMGVPQPIRQQNLQLLVPDLLSYAALTLDEDAPCLDHTQLTLWLSERVKSAKTDYTLSEAIQLISEIEQLWQGKLPLQDGHFVRPIDFSATIAALTS